MKANKRKVFGDAVDLLMDEIEEREVPKGIQLIQINNIQPFHDHPFHLYEGERLEDMIASVKEHGVLNPVIVQKIDGGYEMLSGHNRMNAAKLAGLKEVPAIVKTDLSEEEAYVYVIETNLMQRSFSDLLISEKAAVLKARYEKGACQGKRNDIVREIARLEGKELDDATCGHSDHKLKTRDSIGKEYELSGSSVGRLLKLNDLIKPFKDMVDKKAVKGKTENGFIKGLKTVGKFFVSHPVESLEIAAVVVGGVVEVVTSIRGNSSGGNSIHSSGNNSSSTTSESTSVASKVADIVEKANRATPHENDVPAHRQRYHTKAGVVWRDKDPYHRGGNS